MTSPFRVIPGDDKFRGYTEFTRPDGSKVAAVGTGPEVEWMLVEAQPKEKNDAEVDR